MTHFVKDAVQRKPSRILNQCDFIRIFYGSNSGRSFMPSLNVHNYYCMWVWWCYTSLLLQLLFVVVTVLFSLPSLLLVCPPVVIVSVLRCAQKYPILIQTRIDVYSILPACRASFTPWSTRDAFRFATVLQRSAVMVYPTTMLYSYIIESVAAEMSEFISVVSSGKYLWKRVRCGQRNIDRPKISDEMQSDFLLCIWYELVFNFRWDFDGLQKKREEILHIYVYALFIRFGVIFYFSARVISTALCMNLTTKRHDDFLVVVKRKGMQTGDDDDERTRKNCADHLTAIGGEDASESYCA